VDSLRTSLLLLNLLKDKSEGERGGKREAAEEGEQGKGTGEQGEEQQGGAEGLCEFCEDSEATWFCVDCEQRACDACKRIHLKGKTTSGHSFLPSSSLSSSSSSSSLVSPSSSSSSSAAAAPLFSLSSSSLSARKRVSTCPRHPRNELDKYCATCSEVVCSDCLLGHSEHKFSALADAGEGKRAKLEVAIEKVAILSIMKFRGGRGGM
jgi:hypothetical protein